MQEKISELVTGLITEDKYQIYTKYTVVLTVIKNWYRVITTAELYNGIEPVPALKR